MFQQSPRYECLSLDPLPSLPFCSTLPRLLWPQWVLEPGGIWGFMKKFGESGSEESSMPSRTSGRSPHMLCSSIQHPWLFAKINSKAF